MAVPTPLHSDLRTEICIIGAGISGLTTALLLAEEGHQVVVLDDGPIGGGETGRTTAHIVNALDDRYYDLESMHGIDGIRLAAQSHSAAIDKIEEIVTKYHIECDFKRVDGFLFEPPGGDPRNIDREFEAAQRAGLPVELVEKAPVPFDTGRALRFPRQAQFHPFKYLRGLAENILKLGGSIYSEAHVCDLHEETPLRIITTGGRTVIADEVVMATNTPVNDRLVIHNKQAAYRTYVVGLKVPRGSLKAILLWDNDMPYHYVRLDLSSASSGESDILIVGGEDHKTGQPDADEKPFQNLIDWTRQRYPMAGEVLYRWSGQVMEPVDKLGLIGRNPVHGRKVYVITGDSGNGMTHGTIGGMLVTDLIAGRENRWETLYDPARKTFAKESVKEYARENLNVAAQYSDLLKPGEVKSVDEIKRGEGAILRRGGHIVAAYRDENGALTERSAICRHLGCVVRWNNLEKTWDCPCHGSRYDGYGSVLNGPTINHLKEI
ncbi:MAG: FAD-dependent oxidoreductase [Verrucomicrobiota bacterium]|nr:FAD-dependent oxidoreductase [Verrucomicrobiota bacterium]